MCPMCYGSLGRFRGAMSYQVIARKFRPKSFTDFVGQNHVTQTLTNAMASGRFPHALLLTGPRGTGKTTTARILAKTVLCEERKDSNPCGTCHSCISVTEGSHLDVLEIDGASNNGVDHIRELRDSIGYMPSSGKYKIYIIDEVHMLSTSAFNALLKTLEEPPEHVIFIFATTEVQKIPATILSRCQRYDFRNHTLSDIKNHLQNICSQEQVQFEEEALWTIAKQARGSIRDSLTLLDQLISHGQGHLKQQDVMTLLGLNDRGLLIQVLEAISEQNDKKIFEVIALFKDSGSDPHLFAEEFLEVLRNALLVKMGHHKSSDLALSEHEIKSLEKAVENLNPEDIHLAFDVTLSGLQRLSYSSEPSLALEMLLFKLLYLPRLTQGSQALATHGNPSPAVRSQTPSAPRDQITSSAATLLAQGATTRNAARTTNIAPSHASTAHSTSAAEPNSNPASAAAPNMSSTSARDATPTGEAGNPTAASTHSQPVPQKAATPPLVPLEPVGRTWPDFVNAVKQNNGFLGALLEHTFILKDEGRVLNLGLPEKMSFLMDKLTETKNVQRTQNFLKAFWNDEREVEVQLVSKREATVALSPKAMEEKAKKQQALTDAQKIEAHPLVRATENIFKENISKVGVVDNKRPQPQETKL